ncbi:hypothetical protein G7054_g1410 [Neopestalotiopsis clavispora]|nr:hypothetical protein G7054_g1410 [Neopestalotiopsis clavispora]
MSRRPDKVVIPETTEARSKLDMSLDEINNRAQRSASKRASRAKRQREEEDEGPKDSDVEEIVRKDGPFASREMTKRPRLEAVNDSDLIKVVSRRSVLRDVYNKEDPESQDFVTRNTLQTLGMSSSEQNLIKMTAGVIERNKV